MPIYHKYTVVLGFDKYHFWINDDAVDERISQAYAYGNAAVLLGACEFAVAGNSQTLMKGHEIMNVKEIFTHFLNANPFSSERRYTRYLNTDESGNLSFVSSAKVVEMQNLARLRPMGVVVEETADIIIHPERQRVVKNMFNFGLEHVIDTVLTGAYFPDNAA